MFIVKDTEGYIYGGYASQPWEKHSDFYGDLKCFLLQLHPKVSIFRPTGANNNLQWVCNELIDFTILGIAFLHDRSSSSLPTKSPLVTHKFVTQ